MVLKKLNSFISSERERFDTRHNNMFALAFSEVVRYYEFIAIISKRYEKLSKLFVDNFNKFQASLSKEPGSHLMTPQQIQIQEEGREITTRLHLEIESFYLFAKILLDKVARAIEFYFGKERGLSLDSHDKLSKNIDKYCSKKGLEINEKLVLVEKLKNDISNFRDRQIAHLKAPRAIRGTGFVPTGNTRISLTNIYPKPGEEQIESKAIIELLDSIDAYLQKTIHFIRENYQKTNLQLKTR